MHSPWHTTAMQLLKFSLRVNWIGSESTSCRHWRDLEEVVLTGTVEGMDVAGGYQFTEEKKYNEKLEIINHQSKVKYENQRNSLAAHKEYLLYCR